MRTTGDGGVKYLADLCPFEEFYGLLNSLHIKFNVLEIRESRLKLNTQLLQNMNLENYYIKEIPAGKEGALLYVFTDTNYKVRNDLKV